MENNIKRVILIGITGHGKTTLFNRLTGSTDIVQLGTKSITNTITKRKSKLENFEVLDTPSLGYNEEKLKHCEDFLRLLQQTEIHRIILVIKHDRIVQIIKQIKSMFKFFKNYKEIITIYISYFDLFRGDVNKEKQLIQTRIQNELQIDSFIYGDLTDASIINQLNLILQSSKKLPILFCLDEIIEYFDVFNLKDCVSIEYLKENLNTQFNIRVYQPIMNSLENFPKQISDPLYLNYLDELQNFAKQKVEEYVEQLCDKMKNQFQVNTNNTQYKTFQETLNLKLSQITSKINEKKRGHPKIKACPYCDLLQVMENEGNIILCGENTGNSFSSLKLKLLVKFEYKIENMQVKLIEYKNIQLFKDKDELIKELLNSIKDQQFEQIINQFNINYENEFIELLQKEFGKSCFDQWIQIMDKRSYNQFIKTITETLIKSKNKPQERIIGCGKQFQWKEEIQGIVNQKEENPPQFIQQSLYADSNRKRVVLIGTTGFGKTTLFNRLTGAQEKTSRFQSTTRNIILGYSKADLSKKQFEVMDTPGLGDVQEKMKHIAGILAGLIQNTVYRIILIIRHEKRNELMVREIELIYKFFKHYKDQITIYISHFDLFQGDVNQEKQLIQTRIQNEFNITSFIYNEKQSDASIIQQFNQILETSGPMSIKFSIEQIIECFDIFDLQDEDELQIDDGQMIQKYCETAQIPILKFLEKFSKSINDPLYLNYLDELQNFAKKNVEEFLMEFINQYGQVMKIRSNSNIFQYVPYIEYFKSLKLKLSQIILDITNKKQAHPDFIGNQIKACPYCGLLQVKEQNSNKILCGEGAGRFSLSLKIQPLVKLKYKIENNQVILIENDIQLFKDKDELINKLKDSYNKKQFGQIFEKFNIKHDYEFIELLKKEFGNSCFDKWLQIIDIRNYNKFSQMIKELLFSKSYQLGERTEGKFGCGKYFFWENESLGKLYQIAKPLIKQQIQELNDNDLLKIPIIPVFNNDLNFDLFQWLRGLEEMLSSKINYHLNQMKETSQIESIGKNTGLKQFHF